MEPTDEALMQAVAAGDRRALGTLYVRHAERVHRVAWRHLHDDEAARDVTQAVFTHLIEHAGRFDPRRPFRPWLYRVVANRCFNTRARAEVRLRDAGVDDAALDARADERGPTPENAAALDEVRTHLRRALAELPERQRLALVLADVEGLGQREIADALGCSVGSVESLLVRARRGLREGCPACREARTLP